MDGIEEILRVLVTISVSGGEEKSETDVLDWLTAISKLEKFSLMLSFANAQLIEKTVTFVRNRSEDNRAVELIRAFGGK